MSDRARIMGLMARREGMKVMQLQAELARLTRRKADVAATVERLDQLAAEAAVPTGQAMSAGKLLQGHQLVTEIAQEQDRQAGLLSDLGHAMEDAKGHLASQDQRRDWLDEAAKTARRADRAERDARIAAAQPVVRPRG